MQYRHVDYFPKDDTVLLTFGYINAQGNGCGMNLTVKDFTMSLAMKQSESGYGGQRLPLPDWYKDWKLNSAYQFALSFPGEDALKKELNAAKVEIEALKAELAEAKEKLAAIEAEKTNAKNTLETELASVLTPYNPFD